MESVLPIPTMSTNFITKAIPALPWIRHKDEIPGPLPTRTEIEAATAAFLSIFDPSARRTVLVKNKFVVKYGPAVFENEGHALIFLEKFTQIPTPRLYAMYWESDKLFIIMEFISGQGLDDVWPHISEEEKSPIVSQLRQILDHVRALPSLGIASGVYGGPLPHRYFFSLDNDPLVTGPFTTEEDVCQALVLRSKRNWDEYGRRGWMSEFFSRHLSTMLRNHEMVFTHSDFQRKNILVQEQSIEGGLKRFQVVAILDWEFAGWYPSYWEYASCFAHSDWSDDWAEKVEQILDPYLTEGAVMKLVVQDLDS
ncbi:kinase-like protein [Durotheca rogersii]|uniref:kinase-like protein n=1 Tax=Durotheca rogersii TaxID=419775 RepID=UPI0022201A0B|nr:kinase-like protein [Durotheca rogersii]KAI5860733.1 kinase-like protein [Durotheca rogersii]